MRVAVCMSWVLHLCIGCTYLCLNVGGWSDVSALIYLLKYINTYYSSPLVINNLDFCCFGGSEAQPVISSQGHPFQPKTMFKPTHTFEDPVLCVPQGRTGKRLKVR